VKKILLFLTFIFLSSCNQINALEVWLKGEEHPDKIISSFSELAKADKSTRNKIVRVNVYGENEFFKKREAGYPGYILTLAPNVEILKFNYVYFIPETGTFYSKAGTADLSFLGQLKKLKRLSIKGGCENKYAYCFKAFKNRTNILDYINHISEEIAIDEKKIEKPGFFDKIFSPIWTFIKKIARAIGIHSTVKKLVTKTISFDQSETNHIRPSTENPFPDDTGKLVFKNYKFDKEVVDGIVQALPAMENDKIESIAFHSCSGKKIGRLLRMMIELHSVKISVYKGEINELSELVPVLIRHKKIEKITFENCGTGIFKNEKETLFRAGIDVSLVNTELVE